MIDPIDADIGRHVLMYSEKGGSVSGTIVSISDDLVQMRLDDPAIPGIEIVWAETKYLEWR